METVSSHGLCIPVDAQLGWCLDLECPSLAAATCISAVHQLGQWVMKVEMRPSMSLYVERGCLAGTARIHIAAKRMFKQ